MTTRAALGGLFYFALLVSSSPSSSSYYDATTHQQRHRRAAGLSTNERQQQLRTLLGDGLTECASCPNNDKLACSGTTIADEFCAPCATGQLWWPCNILDECYCKDLAAAAVDAAAAAAAATAEASTATAAAGSTATTATISSVTATTTIVNEPNISTPPCEIPLCQVGEYNLTKVVPFTNCTQWGSCSAGIPGTIQTCPPGQAYSTLISACNILSMVTCIEDPPCPTPPTASPVMVLEETFESSSGDGDGGDGMTMDDSSTSISAPPPLPPKDNNIMGITPGRGIGSNPLTLLDPSTIEGMYVIDAHMTANKIVLSRDLLTSPNNDYSFASLRSSLHFMITIGVANQTFYIGQDNGGGGDNGRGEASSTTTYAYGLVNIAAFVAMSVEDSISRGSCDELNVNVVEGVLPFSNACGQFGLNYREDLKCSDSESMYDCEVDTEMRVMAKHPLSTTDDGKSKNDVLPKPFFCGPKSDYGGKTGFWDYVNGVESKDPAESETGRQDVEGCCWWGRGSLQLRGTCAYGKLNYFLGKRAAEEGRPSLFPDIDFCRNPQAVCSNTQYPDLKWIAGLFRWVTEIQSYNKEGFQYVQQLREFVDGGLQDWSFIQGVSGIVTQGCHNPPCREGAVVIDGNDRMMTFIKTLQVLGLPVKDGTIPSIKTSR